MAKKIVKAVGGALGIGKKKKAEPEVVDDQKHEPIIKDISAGIADPRKRRLKRSANILGPDSETLGG